LLLLAVPHRTKIEPENKLAHPSSYSASKPPLLEMHAMEKVIGIGGLFFRAKDPKQLAQWYQEHLGVTRTPDNYDDPCWTQQAGPTVFAPFPEQTTYFGRDTQAWMVNFRVRDLDAMAAQLRAASIEITIDAEVYPNGRFARLHDPEGNPIELWEPREPKAP
jgi:glyoxylase I family protein